MSIQLQPFYDPEHIAEAVTEKVKQTRAAVEVIDYLAFIPEGEPTLDIHLEKEIDLLKPLGVKIAVITNSTLINLPSVQKALLKADWVSLKVDAVSPTVWHRIDRPHRKLDLKEIHEGMLSFAKAYSGKLVTETMLVEGINDQENILQENADFIQQINPHTAYISIPTRPPAEEWVMIPNEGKINLAYNIYAEKLSHVELLMGYEGNAFASSGNLRDDLLSITAVHPMREDAVRKLVERTQSSWMEVESLIKENLLIKSDYRGQSFYARKLN
jgi:wyosine [tRNA(Phe)-imidazoG37] synthetase (radical SAM superfamily)